MFRSFLIFFSPKQKCAFYWLNPYPWVGDFKRQDVAKHFKHLSLFMDVINFLLHHLMWHVLLQMCAQKNSPLHAGVEVSESGSELPDLLSLLNHNRPVEQSNVTLIQSQQWSLFVVWSLFPSAPCHPTPLISYTASDWSRGGRGLHVEEHVATRWMARSAPLSPLIVKY